MHRNPEIVSDPVKRERLVQPRLTWKDKLWEASKHIPGLLLYKYTDACKPAYFIGKTKGFIYGALLATVVMGAKEWVNQTYFDREVSGYQTGDCPNIFDPCEFRPRETIKR